MTGRIRRLAGFLLALFLLQVLGAAYWQVWVGPRLAQDPRNPRLLLAEDRVERGNILDRNYAPLARTRVEARRAVREYPTGPLFAHLVGYRHPRLGKAGLEASLDGILLGATERTPWEEWRDRVLGGRRRGFDVVLTVDQEIQQVAAQALGGWRGAVVALDPRDGAILAMVSAPSFDPNLLERNWAVLRRDPTSPLLNRATHGLYPPGSTFKVVTMAAALSRRAADPDMRFFCPGFILVRGRPILDLGGRAHGSLTLREALVWSCNVTFVHLGLRVGGSTLREFAAAFGLGEAPPSELPSEAGHLPDPEEVAGDGVAQLSFGQGSLLVTPLQMALLTAVLARGGVRIRPYMVAQVRTAEGEVVERHRARSGERILVEGVARVVRDTMVEVVTRGTGRAAALPGVAVAGKTGTATAPGGAPHAWFIGFAPAHRPRVVVAVVVERAGTGGQVAAPIAREVLRRALERVP
ncbi:MAG: penicillin-binding transpeptidase domain-containing protein [Armatimonadetes bacterium]|nr:penicillin-binding transpeptidase domain-containing protein [Armatimonadota bacterium]MDW8153094.1 penicillin-binding transpeptidase domain-containing protein [Armatimonadota bacterium]